MTCIVPLKGLFFKGMEVMEKRGDVIELHLKEKDHSLKAQQYKVNIWDHREDPLERPLDNYCTELKMPIQFGDEVSFSF